VAALPGWAVQPYLDRNYVACKPVGKKGLQSRLYAATTQTGSRVAYMEEFLRIMREVSFSTLRGIEPLSEQDFARVMTFPGDEVKLRQALRPMRQGVPAPVELRQFLPRR
jgi:hypothetical protein